jgi:SAM-dependent methyltransferase
MGTREILISKLNHVQGKTLDLGAGNAKYKKLITKNTSEYIAFDKFSGQNIDVVGDLIDLPFKENDFDTIVCTQVFEHVEKPWDVVPEIRRVLKSGGKCIITAPFMIPYHADPGDYFRFSTEGFESLFRDGFDILEVGKYGSIYAVLSELLRFSFVNPYQKNSRFKMLIFKIISRFLMTLDNHTTCNSIYSNSYIIVSKK